MLSQELPAAKPLVRSARAADSGGSALVVPALESLTMILDLRETEVPLIVCDPAGRVVEASAELETRADAGLPPIHASPLAIEQIAHLRAADVPEVHR
jgi:hypothetical protein